MLMKGDNVLEPGGDSAPREIELDANYLKKTKTKILTQNLWIDLQNVSLLLLIL